MPRHVSHYAPYAPATGHSLDTAYRVGREVYRTTKKINDYFQHKPHKGTQTHKKVHSSKIAVTAQHGGLSERNINIYLHRANKKLNKSSWNYVQMFGGATTSQGGFCGSQLVAPYNGATGEGTSAALIGSLFTIDQILSTRSGTTTAVKPGYFNTNLLGNADTTIFDIDPYMDSTGGAVIAAGKHSGQQAMMFEKVQDYIQLRNNTTSSNDVCVYWFLCKKGTAEHPVTMWIREQSAAMGSEYSIAAATGPSAAQPTTGYISPLYIVDNQITRSRLVKKHFKLLHEEKFVLDAGDVKKMNVTIHINKVYKKEAFTNLPSNVGYYPGLSIAAVVIANGVPVYATLGVAGELAPVSTSAMEIISVVSRKFTFAGVPIPETKNFQITTVGIQQQLTYANTKQVIDTDDIAVEKQAH